MIEQVFWQAERECKAKEPPAGAPLPDAVDVAVIGGGLTGLSAARTLAKGGASVAVFETNTVGWGASGRNGGQVSVGGKRGPAGWAKDYGQETAARLFQASVDSVTFVEDLVKKEKIDCGWTRCGKYGACYKPEHFGHLAEYQKYMSDTFDYTLELGAAGPSEGGARQRLVPRRHGRRVRRHAEPVPVLARSRRLGPQGQGADLRERRGAGPGDGL